MLRITLADLHDPAHADALLDLLDHYARDAMGGAAPLGAFVRANLVPRLRERSGAFALLAYDGSLPVGLAICLEGFSTFAARPLVNVHDLVVRESHRGRGIGRALLAEVEAAARRRGACKLTLEVLEGNARARAAYAKAGFVHATVATFGAPLFLTKALGE